MSYKFQNIELRPDTRELLRDGALVAVQPKAFELLLYLIENRDRAIDRDELLDKIWPGTFVSETALTRCIMKARKAVTEDADQQSIIKTIHGHGYRFVEELIEQAQNIETTTPTVPSAEPHDRPSIAVLPFDNMSDDPGQDHFADGMSEDIITALSKTPKLFVISRNSTFVYKGKAVDVRDVGREQGVRYVLEGSVRRAGERLRITAQLIDAQTGMHVWADRYDKAIADIFDLQDEITREIVSALQVNLTLGEQASVFSKGTSNLLAWEKITRAHDLIHLHLRENVERGIQLSNEALEIDPDYSSAYMCLAIGHYSIAYGGWSNDPIEELEKARTAADNAIRLDPKNGMASVVLAICYTMYRDFDNAEACANRALSFEPNNAFVLGLASVTFLYCDDLERSVALAQKAMRHCPIYPAWMPIILAGSLIGLGRADEAIVAGEQAMAIDDGNYRLFQVLSGSYAAAGKMELAKQSVEKLLALKPEYSLAYVAMAEPYKNLALAKKMQDLLKEAGVPET